jgi:hypothetical protein
MGKVFKVLSLPIWKRYKDLHAFLILEMWDIWLHHSRGIDIHGHHSPQNPNQMRSVVRCNADP